MTSPQIELIRRLFAGEPLPGAGPVADLAAAHPEGVARARALVAQGLDAPATAAATRALFDRLAAEAPEAGVALYSLGDPALLDAATAELVAVIDRWAPLAGAAVLDFGCGIGRVAAAMAARGARVTGIDISPMMIAEAVRRMPSAVRIDYRAGGVEALEGLPAACLDTLLAADSMPYLVADGSAARLVAGAARLLRPGGRLLVFNWSYRGDRAADLSDATRLAAAHGFDLRRAGETPFAIWDAAGWLLERRA
jgi:SAM-dependent methyltransferase